MHGKGTMQYTKIGKKTVSKTFNLLFARNTVRSSKEIKSRDGLFYKMRKAAKALQADYLDFI